LAHFDPSEITATQPGAWMKLSARYFFNNYGVVEMTNSKQSSKQMASKAASTLNDPSASKIQKSLAASVLSQSSTDNQTSGEMETVASKVLQSDKYADDTKSLAASVLSQSNKSR